MIKQEANTPSSPIELRVLIADDHPLVRDGWRMVLSTLPEAVLVGSAATGREAVQLAAQQHPDIVVMDLHMPELDGIEATRQILAENPATAVLVLTGYDDNDALDAALRAGARGYLLKGAGAVELAAALRTVSIGQMTFASEIGDRLRDRLIGGRHTEEGLAFPGLTARETEVLDLMAAGWNDNQIARTLYLSPKTVRNHIANLLPKIPVKTRTQAILRALDAGFGAPKR